jgi:hypothetical protein
VSPAQRETRDTVRQSYFWIAFRPPTRYVMPSSPQRKWHHRRVANTGLARPLGVAPPVRQREPDDIARVVAPGGRQRYWRLLLSVALAVALALLAVSCTG